MTVIYLDFCLNKAVIILFIHPVRTNPLNPKIKGILGHWLLQPCSVRLWYMGICREATAVAGLGSRLWRGGKKSGQPSFSIAPRPMLCQWHPPAHLRHAAVTGLCPLSCGANTLLVVKWQAEDGTVWIAKATSTRDRPQTLRRWEEREEGLDCTRLLR